MTDKSALKSDVRAFVSSVSEMESAKASEEVEDFLESKADTWLSHESSTVNLAVIHSFSLSFPLLLSFPLPSPHLTSTPLSHAITYLI